MTTRPEQLGERIRDLRYRRGMSQAQLAAKAGVGEKTLSRLEAGKTDNPHAGTLAAVAGALGLAPTELLDQVESSAPPPAPTRPSMHQLPRAPSNFTGRERELAELCEPSGTQAIAIAGIHGMGGIGKTALALKVAERWSERYPDGQLYFDLRGTSDPVKPSEAMLHVIRSLDPGRAAPNTDMGVQAAYRSVLRDRRVLLLMDNAANREQLEPLVPPEGSALLCTSRQRFAMPGLHSLSLTPLDGEDGARLIRSLAPRVRELGPQLAGLCGGLPLALSLVGRALAERPDLDAAEYAMRLADDRERLPHLDASAESDGVEASFGLSYAMLDEADREGLGALSVCPQDFDRAAAAALWALSERDTDARIGRLVRLHLLEPSGSGASARYRFHDLVRLFVRPRLEPTQAATVAMRHAEHFVELLVRADTALQRERQDDDAATEDLAAADREWTHITAGIAHCRQHAQGDSRAAELCCQASRAATILRLRVDPRTRIGWLHTALRIAVDRTDRSLEGKLSVQIARAHQELGDPRRAIELCEQALALIDEDDHATRVSALVALGDAHHAVGDPQRSIEYGEHALRLAREIGARREEAEALLVLAWGYRVRGDLDRTIECCERSLPIAREFRDRSLEASALLAKAFAHQARGERDLAREMAQKCARIGRDNGDRRVEGYSLIALGQRDGRNHFQECLEIARETGDRRMAGNAQLALGFSHATAGRIPDAIHAFEQALAVAVETTDKAMEGIALTALGFVYIFANEIDRAIAVLGRDEELSRTIGHRSQQAAAAWLLGIAYQRAGLTDAALDAEERYRALTTSGNPYPGLARMQRALGHQ